MNIIRFIKNFLKPIEQSDPCDNHEIWPPLSDLAEVYQSSGSGIDDGLRCWCNEPKQQNFEYIESEEYDENEPIGTPEHLFKD